MLSVFEGSRADEYVTVLMEGGEHMADNEYANAHKVISVGAEYDEDAEEYKDHYAKVHLFNTKEYSHDGDEAYVYYLMVVAGDSGVEKDACMSF